MLLSNLHAPLESYVEEAGTHLAGVRAAGEEVPFELVQRGSGRRRTPLYCYRPLTEEFIDHHRDGLEGLASFRPAVRALAGVENLERYLQARGEPRMPATARERATLALVHFLAAVFDDATDFAASAERFQRAYGELEAVVVAGTSHTVVVAELHGVAIASPALPLGGGLVLARRDGAEDVPEEALWSAADDPRPTLLTTITLSRASDGPSPTLAEARARLSQLLTALRLYGGEIGFSATGWMRMDGGAWQTVPIALRGTARGAWVVAPDQEDELRAFCNLVARRTPSSGEVAWALARFEMGCERERAVESLTDYLLALRALLEPEGPRSGRLAGRLAALCALPEDRPALAERIAHAISLERAVIGGLAPAESRIDALVAELGGHVRALLRDVLCGHLDSDLRTVADELIEVPEADPATVLEPADVLPGASMEAGDHADESSALPGPAAWAPEFGEGCDAGGNDWAEDHDPAADHYPEGPDGPDEHYAEDPVPTDDYSEDPVPTDDYAEDPVPTDDYSEDFAAPDHRSDGDTSELETIGLS